MPQQHHTSSRIQAAIISFSLLISLLPTSLQLIPDLDPDPDPASIRQQNLLPTPTPSSQPPSTTIPSFPEQSAVAGCPLNLPDEFFAAVKTSCAINVGKKGSGSMQQEILHRSLCCPVLGAWLYWAYSETALGRVAVGGGATAATYDMMPLLPDDSETCVDGMEKVMRERGMDLEKVNETCDVVYCYCGIRLRTLNCPASFHAADKGTVVGDEHVRRLESDCLRVNASSSDARTSCSNCLNSLQQQRGKVLSFIRGRQETLSHEAADTYPYALCGWNMVVDFTSIFLTQTSIGYSVNFQLKKGESGSSEKPEDRRTRKMHSKECELMGLTWLLAKNRTAYIDTVTSVLRALMMSKDDADPRSCSLNSNGMPLAVDYTEISSQSSAASDLTSLLSLFLLVLSLL
ncbi:hypothetical protein Ancab_038698 [Ancistrocladus abbreviatus]